MGESLLGSERVDSSEMVKIRQLRDWGVGIGLLAMVGCMPVEESSAPSAALFPTSNLTFTSSELPAQTETNPSPASLPSRNLSTESTSTESPAQSRTKPSPASQPSRNLSTSSSARSTTPSTGATQPRYEVEIRTLYGNAFNINDQKLSKPLQAALEQGYFEDKNTGKRLYRIQSLYQAQQILKLVWSEDHWVPDSELSKRFQTVPNASVVIVGPSDQRILFFDQSGHFIGVYTPAS